MDTVVKFIVAFVIVILPFVLSTIWNRFDGLDEEIRELKRRINKLENKKE